MADNSKIEWTDATWNPVTGCTKVSPGCAHCYIERTPAFRVKGRKFVRGTTGVLLHYDRLDQPLRWRRPRRVFVNSLSDLFHADVPETYIDRVFAVMAMAQRHTFQVLTKRPERMREYMDATYMPGGVVAAAMELETSGWPEEVDLQSWPPKNVWLGVSVENQRFADERIPHLLHTRAAVRYVSYEPALGPVDFSKDYGPGRLDWVIPGGESGPRSRPFDLQWARNVLMQFPGKKFVKQLGANAHQRVMYGPATFESDQPVHLERVKLKNRKGGDPNEWPEDLRVREFPDCRALG